MALQYGFMHSRTTSRMYLTHCWLKMKRAVNGNWDHSRSTEKQMNHGRWFNCDNMEESFWHHHLPDGWGWGPLARPSWDAALNWSGDEPSVFGQQPPSPHSQMRSILSVNKFQCSCSSWTILYFRTIWRVPSLYKCNKKSASKWQEYKIQMTNNTGPNFVKLDLSG